MKGVPLNWITSVTTAAFLFCLTSPWLRAQSSDAQSTDTTKSWTDTSESQYSGGSNPLRRTESHTQSGNRTIDKQSVERLGPDGYEPYLDTETESVQLNSSTIRTTTRIFGRSPSNEKSLIQVTEEETQNLAGGDVKRVRATSSPDLNGRLQLVQREIQETRKTSPDVQEIRTTVFLPDVNGGLAPSSQTVEHQKRTSQNSTEFQRSTKVRDGNGNWQVSETREGTIKQDGKDRTTEERVSQPDSEGRLSVISRTVKKDTESNGERHATVETYSTYIPGSGPDGNLHLIQRATTLQKHGPGGQTTEQQVEERNPGDPSASLRVSTKTIDIVRPSAGGTQETRTTQVLAGSGDLAVVEVDTRNSDKVPAIKIDIEPPQKPK
jgi:hypothetical protein